MKDRRPLQPPHPALQALAHATEPTDAELQHLLSRRPTRVDAELRERMAAMADATEATWAEELHARLEPTPLAGRDPRAPGWARVTDPSDTEVARVTTTPLPGFLAVLTAPTDAEVHALLLRRAELVGARRQRWLPIVASAGVLATAATAAVLAITLWPTSDAGYGTPDLAQGATAMVAPSDVVDLGPSIDLMAHPVAGAAVPRVHIAAADSDGTVVDVLDGGTRFSVDPTGSYRNLTVRAGDVEVRVKGTVFTVDHVDDAVHVAVERGVVEVSTPSGQFELAAGERWTSIPDTVASADPIPTAATGPIDIVMDKVVDENLGPARAAALPSPAARRVAVSALARSTPNPPADADDPDGSDPESGTPTSDQPDADGNADDAAVLADASGVATDAAEVAVAADEPRHDAPATDDQGTSEAVPMTTAAVDLVAITELRDRHWSGEEPTTLLRDVDAALVRTDTRLRPMVLRLRADVIARTGDLRALDASLGNLIVNSSPAHQPSLYVERARVRELRGDLRGALGDFRRAEHAPGQTGIQALVGIASAAHALNRPGEAREALLEALQRAPDQETEERLTVILEGLNAR